MAQKPVNIEVLNFASDFGYNLRPMKHETLDTSKQSMLVLAANEWNRLPNSSLFAVIKIFQIEKFLREFPFSSISSVHISTFCI